MNIKRSKNEDNFIIGPIFESVVVGQCKEMKNLLGCDNSYVREFLTKIANKYFL